MKNPQTKTLKSQTQIPCSQSPSMESFSLLSFLRRDDNGDGFVSSGTTGFISKEETQKIKQVESEENGDDDDDDGPFFDLEFSVPEEEDVDNGKESDFGEEEEEDGDDDDDELNFIDPNLSLSPSDELFFKGSFIQLDSSSSSLDLINSSPNSKSHQFPAVSFLKSATKFRVFMLGFKKPKSEKKLKVEEEVPPSDEKKKLAKYLKMIKQSSKRYGEKMKFSGNLGKISSSSPTSVIPTFLSSPSKKKNFRSNSGNLGRFSSPPTTGFRVVCKHLGKSRSASSSSSSSSSSMTTVLQSKRQDDSLLQQEDGIQSAILYCKRSFNSSSDSSSLLSRSISDPTHEKVSSIDLLRKSQSITEERNGNGN